MNEDSIFERTKDAYLSLIHPVPCDDTFRRKIAPVVALAPSEADDLIAAMITASGWRERLPGLCLAMARRPAAFIESMLQSLREPRGIAIVPVCAALTVLVRRGIFTMPPSFQEMFDRSAFDGEVGWAIDKAAHLAGLRSDDVPGRGPNYGQDFDDHVAVYEWIRVA